MKLIIIIIFFINILTSNVFAQTIAVVNIEYIIENSPSYKKILKKIEISQKNQLVSLENKEKELKKLLNEIDESKIILNENEVNLLIDKYNIELNEFNNLVEEFNIHYQNQIINIREKILIEIITLLEKHAIQKNIDLILDSTSYLIASNSLDITNTINEELSKIIIKLEFEDFEKY